MSGFLEPQRRAPADSVTARSMVSRDTARQMALTQQLAAVAELLPGSCHEINNALTSIIGISDFLMDTASDAVNQELTALRLKAERVASIVGNLQTLARSRPETRRQTDVNDLVMAALDLRSYELRAGGIEVITRLCDTLPAILASENRLRLVFLSIILNAEHALAEAAASDKAAASDEAEGSRGRGVLTVTTGYADGTIRVTIADDGPGIAAGDRKGIFEPFVTSRDAEGGSGVGLSSARAIVAGHGGKISLESVPGGGTVFVVELPVTALEE